MEVHNLSFIGPTKQVPIDTAIGAESRVEGRIHAAQDLPGENRRHELRKVSQEFEAVFVAYLLKIMRETIEESGLLDEGFGKTVYLELFDQEVSQSIARRGALGIGNLLYRNLSVTKPADSAPVPVPSTQVPIPEPQPTLQAPSTGTGVSDKERQEISDLLLPIHAPVSSRFGLRRDPLTHRTKFHRGLDLAAPEGVRVLAALPGTVISAGYEKGYGNTIRIQHAGGLQTRYGHLGRIDVKPGDIVSNQTTLGTVGDTGRSTGPHLHFEVTHMGVPVDPLPGLRGQLAAIQPISGELNSAPEFVRGRYY